MKRPFESINVSLNNDNLVKIYGELNRIANNLFWVCLWLFCIALGSCTSVGVTYK